VVASAGEGDSQDARGEALVHGINYAPDSFDASEDEDNDVEIESARDERLVRGVNHAPDSFDASEDDDNGVEVESARGEALVLGVNYVPDSVDASDDMLKLDLGESVVPCSPLFHACLKFHLASRFRFCVVVQRKGRKNQLDRKRAQISFWFSGEKIASTSFRLRKIWRKAYGWRQLLFG
jgi:hypothetical protein